MILQPRLVLKKQLLATHSLLKQVELEPLRENYDL